MWLPGMERRGGWEWVCERIYGACGKWYFAGAAIGYDKLLRKWIDPLNDRIISGVAGFGEGTISELCERTIAVRKAIG